jgi:diadenosine tetraphosphate (Ap4A) HIT family hydrolase
MTAPRSRKEDRRYVHYLKALKKRGSPCEFCSMDENDPKFVAKTKYFMVVKNLIAYSIWDGHDVIDHLLIIPVQHATSLSELPSESAQEFLELLSEYENKGYNVYARAPQSKARTVVHQHTHLIKSSGACKSFMMFTRKPYLRVSL